MNTLDWITAWLLCGLFVIATGFTFAGDGDFLPDCTNVVENLQDLIQPGWDVTVTFDDASTLVGTFVSWRDNFKYMVITVAADTYVIQNYNHFTAAPPP
jgi:hypothetical protein